MKTLPNTHIVAINHITNECFIATSVTSIAKLLDVHRHTITNNLGDSLFYIGEHYSIYTNIPIHKVLRKGYFANSKSTIAPVRKVVNEPISKPVKELKYEPFFD